MLKYQMDIQGRAFPAKITMKPASDTVAASVDLADGRLVADAKVTKKS